MKEFLFLFFIVSIFISGCIIKGEEIKLEERTGIINISSIEIPVEVNIPVRVSVEGSVKIPYPKPTYIPALRPYDIDKSHDLWHAKDPSSYIEPDNEWVKYYASLLFVDLDGRIKYKNEKVVWWVGLDGTEYYTHKSFVNNYFYDWEQFGTGSQGSLANDDHWANVDYYLTHGMKGDCDEWMTTVTSMMLSGEMSVWQGDKLIKQVIPAKGVLGYMGGYRDGWVEYQVYGKTFLTTTSLVNTGIDGQEKISSTEFVEKNNKNAKPFFEFTDKYFKRV